MLFVLFSIYQIFFTLKKLLITCFALLCCTAFAHAQDDPTLPQLDEGSETTHARSSKRPKDQVLIGFHYDMLLKLPAAAGAKPSLNGFSYTFYPYCKFFGQTGFGAAAGFGVRSSRYKNNVQTWSGTALAYYAPAPQNAFLKTVQINVPLELRYTSIPLVKKRAFKLAAGGSLGYNVVASTFTQYDKVKTTTSGTADLQNATKFCVGLHARVGYEHFGLQANYALSPLFKTGAGAGLYPLSLGVILQ